MPAGVNGHKPWMVFMDFDNTITGVDVLDAVIERFSVSREWTAYEEAWKAGKIGSRECLEAQLRFVRVTRKGLAEYVKEIPLDPFFLRLLRTLRAKKIPLIIVSDSFSFIIKTILKHHGVRQAAVFANELHFEKDRLAPSFPYASEHCDRCAHCKKIHLLAHADKTRVYIGDGLSDVCPALEADKVFAKDSLRTHLTARGKSCATFRDLEEVCVFFEGLPKHRRLRKAAVYA